MGRSFFANQRARALKKHVYKWLQSNGRARLAPIDSDFWKPGIWRSVVGEIVPHQNGLYLCQSQNLVDGISEHLWLTEYEGEFVIYENDKLACRKARILTRVETIDDQTLRAFAADCAERVVYLRTASRFA